MNAKVEAIQKDELERLVLAGLSATQIGQALGIGGTKTYAGSLVQAGVRHHFGSSLSELQYRLGVRSATWRHKSRRLQVGRQDLEDAIRDGLVTRQLAKKFGTTPAQVRYCIKVYWQGKELSDVRTQLGVDEDTVKANKITEVLWQRGGFQKAAPEIEACIRAGLRAKEIAGRLGITVGTLSAWVQKLWGMRFKQVRLQWREETIQLLLRHRVGESPNQAEAIVATARATLKPSLAAVGNCEELSIK